MKSFLQFLNERLSSIVFHQTSLQNVINILSDNRFKLSSVLGTSADITPNKNKFFYMSFSRSPLSSYFSDRGIYLELDGDKLNYNYKGLPVDYWGPEFRKIDPQKHEMEDRIVLDNQFIDNAKKYIKAIYMFSDDYDRVKKIYTMAKKINIPVYIFKDSNSFINRDLRNTLSFDEYSKTIETNKEPYPYFYRRDKNPFSELLELIHKKNYDELSDKAKRLINNMYNYSDTVSSVMSDFHNYKNSPHISKVTDIMKQNNIRSVKELIEFLKDKWKDLF